MGIKTNCLPSFKWSGIVGGFCFLAFLPGPLGVFSTKLPFRPILFKFNVKCQLKNFTQIGLNNIGCYLRTRVGKPPPLIATMPVFLDILIF